VESPESPESQRVLVGYIKVDDPLQRHSYDLDSQEVICLACMQEAALRLQESDAQGAETSPTSLVSPSRPGPDSGWQPIFADMRSNSEVVCEHCGKELAVIVEPDLLGQIILQSLGFPITSRSIG
jgi:hypothetical protein